MPNDTPLPLIRLKPRRPERYGHPWVYDNEVAAVPDADLEDGSLVEIFDHNGKSLGTGYFNTKSKIIARLLNADSSEKIDLEFWRRKLRAALEFRQRVHQPLPPMYRLVHGEADGIPGLIIDRYDKWLIVQILTLGIERQRQNLLRAIWEVFQPSGVYERSDSPARGLEGMEPTSGLLRGEPAPSPLIIEDQGARVFVDLTGGAKTGLFLDQRDNQIAAARLARGRTVFNCFSYTGLFGLRAALAGAKSVTDVEISAEFNRTNEAQWDGNDIRRCAHDVVTANAFDLLRAKEQEHAAYGLVILDPPAFTKSRGQREGAFRGYNEINRRAIKILEPGGVLVTCSCSHHVSLEEFREILRLAAKDAGRSLRLVEQRGQPADHPVLLSAPESEYLKCLIYVAQ
ncbi:MAG: class I SAM-dependent rRNA methyltransferase [Capsulimonadaceae bacterium]|nr:class I SAM-dependent rRNA methyltransferase [Capsulimonadaceae bacterium]